MDAMPWRWVRELMAELKLDYRDKPPFSRGGAVLLGVALLALVLTGAYFLQLRNKAAGWEAKLEQLKGGEGRAAQSDNASGRDAAELALEVEQANEVLRKLTVPWEDLFQAVESPEEEDVTLLALAPDTEKRMVKISGEAKNFLAMLHYITQLEGRPEFGPVYLQSHQIQQQDPEKPVRFSLQAVWREKP